MSYLEEPKKIEERSDEELLGLSIDSPSLFGILVERYQEAFLRKSRRILGTRPEAEDAVQDTFTKIYLNAARFRSVPGASFKSWGYKILINTTFTYYKKLKQKEDFFARIDEEMMELLPDLKSRTMEKEGLRDEVASVLSRMPRALARAVELHFIEDKPQKEVAEMEGVSVAAVKTRIHRAKKEYKKLSADMES